jgi:hypothetical protein
VVAIKLLGTASEPKALELHLLHCKCSGEQEPGARIGDLYEVCGHAQKSVHWMRTPETKTDLLTHLLRRESDRQDDNGPSRFELGDSDLLHILKEVSEFCPMKLESQSSSRAYPRESELRSAAAPRSD